MLNPDWRLNVHVLCNISRATYNVSLDPFFLTVAVIFCKYRLSWYIVAFQRILYSWIGDIYVQTNFTIHQFFCWWFTIRCICIGCSSVTSKEYFLCGSLTLEFEEYSLKYIYKMLYLSIWLWIKKWCPNVLNTILCTESWKCSWNECSAIIWN